MKRRKGEMTDLVRRILAATAEPSRLTMWFFKWRWWWLLSEVQVDQIEEHYVKRNLLLAGEVLADDLDVEHEITQQVIQQLIRLVFSKVDLQQEDALVMLSKLPERLRNQFIIPHLLNILSGPEWDMRCQAALALGYLGLASPDVITALRFC